MGGIGTRVKKLEETMGIGGSRRFLTEAEAERLQDLEKAKEQGNMEGGAYLDLLFLRIKASGVRLSTRVLLEKVEALKTQRTLSR
jgi:hypothetical protein